MRFMFAAAVAATLFAWGGARAETAEPEMVEAAKAINSGCVARGEDARVCACGVGLAYAQLDPKVFKLVPKVEPLLDQKDQASAVMSLMAMASSSGLSGGDLMTAYSTIRANQDTVRQICKPLAATARGSK